MGVGNSFAADLGFSETQTSLLERRAEFGPKIAYIDATRDPLPQHLVIAAYEVVDTHAMMCCCQWISTNLSLQTDRLWAICLNWADDPLSDSLKKLIYTLVEIQYGLPSRKTMRFASVPLFPRS